MGLNKNVETSCQIVSTWDRQKCVRFEPGRRDQLWMLSLQTATDKSYLLYPKVKDMDTSSTTAEK